MSSLSPRPFNSMFIVRVVAAALLILGACGGDDDSAAEAAAVFFDEPAAGATVTSPVSVEMEASNLTIEAAGGATEGAGHMHIMVDVPCVTPGETIPADDAHVHYGDGATAAQLELSPGEHTLCPQAGDGTHTALDLTDEITFTVEG